MNLIDRTTVRRKEKGDGLSSSDVNSINETVNKLVEFANCYLSKYCDINIEFGTPVSVYTLETAIDLVPDERRNVGFKVKFRGVGGKFYEYVFAGDSTLEPVWYNLDNWDPVMETIDGGEF